MNVNSKFQIEVMGELDPAVIDTANKIADDLTEYEDEKTQWLCFYAASTMADFKNAQLRYILKIFADWLIKRVATQPDTKFDTLQQVDTFIADVLPQKMGKVTRAELAKMENRLKKVTEIFYGEKTKMGKAVLKQLKQTLEKKIFEEIGNSITTAISSAAEKYFGYEIDDDDEL